VSKEIVLTARLPKSGCEQALEALGWHGSNVRRRPSLRRSEPRRPKRSPACRSRKRVRHKCACMPANNYRASFVVVIIRRRTHSQVSEDHAPYFTGISDRVVCAGSKTDAALPATAAGYVRRNALTGHFDCLEPQRDAVCRPGRQPNRQRASQSVGFAAVAIAVAVFIGRRGRTAHTDALGLRYSAGPFPVPMLAALGLALVHPGKDPRFAFAVGLVVALFNIELGIDRWLAMCEAIIQTSCGNELSYHSGQSETPRKAQLPFVLVGPSGAARTGVSVPCCAKHVIGEEKARRHPSTAPGVGDAAAQLWLCSCSGAVGVTRPKE
jgi:hypothetical protein